MYDWVRKTFDDATSIAITTSILSFVTGFLLATYSLRGYLIPPELTEQRRRNQTDPVESAESDIDDDEILDHAPNWSNGDEADVRDGLRQRRGGGAPKTQKNFGFGAPSTASTSNEECKLVLVVRTDLGMTKGKIAAQCGHATLACYKTLQRAASQDPSSQAARVLQRWERQGQAKIALQAKGEDTLLTLMGTARSLGVTAEVIADAGRTQIESGSLTVLGVGPAPKSLVDKVTGELKLL